MDSWETIAELVHSPLVDHKDQTGGLVSMPHACMEDSSSACSFHRKSPAKQANWLGARRFDRSDVVGVRRTQQRHGAKLDDRYVAGEG